MTIYFKNQESITIMGKEGELVKRKIAYALEHNMRDWITIYNTDEVVTDQSVPGMVLNLAEVIAIR